jgi:DNA-binding NtrC family response regulator
LQPDVKHAVVLIEDDAVTGGSLADRLALEGFGVDWLRSGAEALSRFDRGGADAVLCDIRLPDMSGEALFARLRPYLDRTPVIFMTGFAEIEQAVRLTRLGAADYLEKPFEVTDLLGRLRAAIAASVRLDEGTLGVSASMRSLEMMLRRVADLDSMLLITGESGSGKEVVARFLHQVSLRAKRPFMAVNCAAVPADLMESELFGHERGSFTGAARRHEGWAERAGAGTLFLDEIADLALPLQAKLLRLLQERSFTRVGGTSPVPLQARVLCATNADLEQRVAGGQFRADLYWRIAVIPVHVPPLRAHPDDIPVYLAQFISEFEGAFGREIRGLARDATDAALAHSWPGNVRELRNRVERAVALAEGPIIEARHLFPDRPAAVVAVVPPTLAEARDTVERQTIQQALAAAGGRIEQAARQLGISRSTMFDRMRRLNMPSGT